MKKGYVDLPLAKLVPADWNYKLPNRGLEVKLRRNFERNGQLENIIVREVGKGRYEVVNGNHRLEALRTLGIKNVLCYNTGKISNANARRIAIETNETRFDPDFDKLAMVVDELIGEYGLSDLEKTMPFTQAEMQDFQAYLEFQKSEQKEGEGIKSPKFANSPDEMRIVFEGLTQEQYTLVTETMAGTGADSPAEAMDAIARRYLGE